MGVSPQKKFQMRNSCFSAFTDVVGILDHVPHPNWPDIPKSPQNDNELNLTRLSDDEELQALIVFSKTEAGQMDDEPAISKIDHTPKSAKELLNNLSEILNTTNRSDQQRSAGQQLINSLADLLSDKSNIRSYNLDDSGHSSFINDNSDSGKIHNDEYNILDFSQKTSFDEVQENLSSDCPANSKSKLKQKNAGRLSLSLNSALPPRIIQPKLLKRCNISKISLDNSKNRTSSTNSSVHSDNLSASNTLAVPLQTCLKVKLNKDISRKGPLKATMPMKELKTKGKIIFKYIQYTT